MSARFDSQGIPYDVLSIVETSDRMDFTYDANNNLTKLEVYKDGSVRLTLTLTYDANNLLTKIERS